MPTCRFYLENRCRYGENCRFEHPRGGAQRNLFGGPSDNWQGGGGQRVTFRDSFGTSGQGGNNPFKWNSNQQQNSQSQSGPLQPSTPLDLVNNLPKEMETWEKSHMWPFSSMSIEKDLPSLPEFQDVSMEEMRLEAYQGIKSGNVQPYTQKYQSLLNEFQNKRAQLKHMSMDLKGILVAIVEEGRKRKSENRQSMASPAGFGTAQSSQNLYGQGLNSSGSGLFGQQSVTGMSSSGGGSGGGGGLFGKPASTSAFGVNSSTSGGMFGSGSGVASSAASSSFGSPSSTLFGKPTGSVFGGQMTSQSPPVSNLFGTGSQNNSSATPGLFGGGAIPSQPSANLFGSGTSTAASPSSGLFGNAPASSPPQGLFGKPAPGFGQSGNTPSLFGTNTSTSQAPGLFGSGSANSSSLFGSNAPTGQSSTSAFGVQGQGSGGLFGKGPAQQGFVSQSTFGSQPATGASSGPTDTTGLYTPLADLTDAEKEAFSAKSFVQGKIPLRPPPKELIH